MMSSLLVLRFSSNNSHSSNMFQSLAWFSHLSPRRSLFSGYEPRLFYMVGLSGLEPPTSRLSGVRSNRLSYKPILVLARYFLSRIFKNSCCLMMSSLVVLRFSSNNSHSSNMFQSLAWFSHFSPRRSLFSGYEPRLFLLVEISGIEPLTPCLQSRCSPSWAIPPYISGRTLKIKQRVLKRNLS